MARLGRVYPTKRAIAPVLSGPPIAFDSVGGGQYVPNVISGNFSWNHTIAPNATCLIVPIGWLSTGYPTTTLTIGGKSLTSFSIDYYGTATSGWFGAGFHVWVMMDPPTGAQTLTFTYSGTGSNNFTTNSISYTGVGSIGTVPGGTTGAGGIGAAGGGYGYYSTINTNAPSFTFTGSQPGQVLFNAIATYWTGASTSFTGYSGTNRFSNVNANPSLIMGDLPGGGSVTFSVTTTNLFWTTNNVILPLNPIYSFRQ
jgi:hypothetical protein